MTRPRAGSARRGFTLIEISVVVLIVALLLTSATVQLDRFLPSTRTEAGGRDLLSHLDLARTHAIAKGLMYEFEFNLDESSYRIITPFDEDGKVARDPELRTDLGRRRLPGGVRFGGIVDTGGELHERGSYRLRFDPQGSAEALSIYLENVAGEAYALTVQISALTGLSKIAEGKLAPVVVTEDEL